LKALLDRLAPDVVHCHMPNAHWMAGLARGDAVRPALVRSFYDPEGPADDWRTRWLLRHRTDGAVVITGRAAAALAERQGPGEGRVLVSEPSVDVTRFSPDRPVAGGRADFGLAPEHFVVGVVSRIRDSRRLDIPLGAVARLSGRFPHLRLLIVGRGGEGAVREVVERPAERLGIRDKVVLAGYCQGDRLVAAYRAMDVLAYPMPGTDKSCRTVREAMAAGVAVVASRIGFLKQLVSDGHNGLLTDLSVERMAESVDALAGDREVLGAMRRGALETARDRFAPDRQAARIAVLYENVLANPKR
jgi:glycosyltransferase involved in cell wall biosynthesis